jgi:hypothetical protein
MADVELAALERRARAAYERGRWRRAVLDAWPVLVLAGLAFAFGSRPWLVVALTVPLLVAVVVMGHRGGAWRRAIVPGLVAGSLPMVAGLSACHIPHACNGPECMAWCMPTIGAAGLLGGLVVAHRVLRSQPVGKVAVLAPAALLASLTGAMGCIALGVGGLLGLAAGIAVGMVPALVAAWDR